MTTYAVSDTYRKDTLKSPGYGYGRLTLARTWAAERITAPSSIVIHTTNNSAKNTKIWNEATFIRDSAEVSCHDLIAKDGSVYVILPPLMVAWHAGTVLPAYSNSRSLGIEIHCSVGEAPTTAQIDSLTQRVRHYIKQFGIERWAIETHRAVATPAGRKQDPEGFSDAEFYAWRDALYTETDFAAAWGDAFPYFAESGIAARWRESHAMLGKAISDELAAAANTIVRCFEHGAITYHPTAGTRIVEW